MNVLAVIPARGGSRGVPRKNIRPCAGKPLLVWSIEAALASRFIRQSGIVAVSSDDQEILNTARMVSPQVISIERPPHLATDTGKLDPVIGHAVIALSSFRPDLVVTLQPTCPIRRPGLIDDCIQRLMDADCDSVFTARPAVNCWHREDKREFIEQAEWVCSNPKRLQRQEVPPWALHFDQDGSVRVTRTCLLVSIHPESSRPPRLIGGLVQPYPNDNRIDIDTEADFRDAEALLRARQEQEAIAC